MDSFISSGNIEAFPAALRNIGTGKYTTEDNLATIFRAAAGIESFVVNSSPLEFVVHGHYFKLSNGLTNADTNLTAYIVEDSSTKTLRNIDGSTTLDDESGNFKGVTFALPSTTASGCSIYSLQITDSAGKLINEIPRLSAITVGAGLSTGVTGGTITSTGSIFMPAINYNGATISGSYGPSNNNKNEKTYEAAYNGVLRIPEITIDSYGKVIEANTYSWPISNTHYVSHISAASYVRPLLLGASATSYGENFNGTIAQTAYYNSSVKIDMTGTSAVLIAPKFSGSLSGGIYQTFAPDSAGYQAFLVGSRDTTGYGSIYFARNNTGIDLKSGWIKANRFDGLLFVGPLRGNATTATTADKASSVNQTHVNTDFYRPLALAGAYSVTSDIVPITGPTAMSLYYNTQIFANTKTGTLYAKKFVGEFEGTITTVAETAKFYNGNTTDAHRALIFAEINSKATGTVTANLSYTTNIYTNPSKGYVYANRFIGAAESLTTATVGGNGKMLMWRNGKPSETTTSRGFLDITNQKAQAIYMDNGTITSGQTIYWSTSSATGGAVGDIWIQY